MTPSKRAFTLIELLIVLALLALVAGITTGALRSGSGAQKAAGTLVTRLLDARVIAMRSGAGESTERGAGGATLVVEETERGVRTRVEMGGERVREREVVSPGLTLVDETPEFGWGDGDADDDGIVRARFGVGGRTDARRWVLRSGDTMVVIEFDPLTGVPKVNPEG